MTTNRINFVCILICMCVRASFAQNPSVALPLGTVQPKPIDQVLELPDLDWEKVKNDDARATFDVRFAVSQPLQLSNSKDGNWQVTDNGFRVWRCHIRVPTGKGLSLMLNHIDVPNDATVSLYDSEKKHFLGPYSAAQLMAQNGFMTGIISGKSIIIEYKEPITTQKQGTFDISRIDVAYRDEQSFMSKEELSARGFGDALACHINANCADGNDWNNEKRGVCRILMVLQEGQGWCTGTLINNARQDGKPYILTAFHCQDTYTPIYSLWRFDFGFESSNCITPSSIPDFKFMLGCNYRAGKQGLDFLLLELDNDIPKSFNVYYNGWDRQSAAPTTTVSLHHPKGDIKKITYDTGNTTQIFNQSIQWNTNFLTPAGNHFVSIPNKGTLQSGSSGCALFNQNHKLVATLGGGNFNNCIVDNAYYPRFSLMWNQGGSSSTQLREWLDPDATNITSIDGAAQQTLTNKITGKIETVNGKGINLVGVILQDSTMAFDSTTTDTSGVYTFNIPRYKTNFYVLPTKYINIKNGISTFDLVLMRKQILNIEPLPTIFHKLAADVNNSGSVSTADVVAIQKMNLNLTKTFVPNIFNSWSFYNKIYNPNNLISLNLFFAPIQTTPAKTLYKTDFIGVKIGDANQSADPAK